MGILHGVFVPMRTMSPEFHRDARIRITSQGSGTSKSRSANPARPLSISAPVGILFIEFVTIFAMSLFCVLRAWTKTAQIVFLWSHAFKMRRVNAMSNSAKMVKVMSIWLGAMQSYPWYLVAKNAFLMVISPNSGISVSRESSGPNPTWAEFWSKCRDWAVFVGQSHQSHFNCSFHLRDYTESPGLCI